MFTAKILLQQVPYITGKAVVDPFLKISLQFDMLIKYDKHCLVREFTGKSIAQVSRIAIFT